MSPTTTTTTKRTVRARKTAVVPSEAASTVKPVSSSVKNLKAYEDVFTDLVRSVNESKEDFMSLQREIDEARESWSKEQHNHETAVLERNQQEEVMRKRETETYVYEIAVSRKKAEDEFLERKNKWERELAERKEEIQREKEELEMLRRQVAGFEEEKEKAVKEASNLLQKELNDQYGTEKRLREQEVKAEKELQALKIINLTSENTRLVNEVLMLKKSLEEATAQLKDVAVKVIESGNPIIKPSAMSE